MVAGVDGILPQLSKRNDGAGQRRVALAGFSRPPDHFMTRPYFFASLILVVATACGSGKDVADTIDVPVVEAAPGLVVDSALSMDTLVRRFQTGLERPVGLSHGATSADALTRSYLEALAASDTAALREMHLSRAEYAFLYFPESRMTKPPYELPPEVAWMLLASESSKGLTTVLRRVGGRRLLLERVRCGGEPLRDGTNLVLRDCVVDYRDDQGARGQLPLFAAIIARDGRFKFFSYATTL